MRILIFLTVTAASLVFAPALLAADYDLVIRNGRVVDGSGAPARKADVAVEAGHIVLVGRVPGTGRDEIDARGQVVAPGFIDVHTHSENIAELPLAENFIRMGVTTIISGNCGSSTIDVKEYFNTIRRTGIAVNVGTLVGQGSIRSHVMGGSFMRPASAQELDRMRSLVTRAMSEGAFGLSTGLIYLPGTFTKTAELIELARAAAQPGGIYVSHMRHENVEIFGALQELVEIARGANIRAHVSHLKLSGPNAWGRTHEVLAVLTRARAEGLQLTHDQYAYTASSTGISTLVPSSAREGGTKAFAARIADPKKKANIVEQMKKSLRESMREDFAYAVIAHFEKDPRLAGLTVPQAAKIVRGSDSLTDQIELIFAIVEQGGAQGVFHTMDETDVQKFMQLPETMIASDSGPRRWAEGVPHPRGYGNNARVLGRYVRELKILTLEDAVRKMTMLPAQTFRLSNRGKLAPGAMADIVIFNPDQVTDPATFAAPHHYAVGFTDVLVNGVAVIRSGQLTGACPGQPVRMNRP